MHICVRTQRINVRFGACQAETASQLQSSADELVTHELEVHSL